jgi:hypothetical protein
MRNKSGIYRSFVLIFSLAGLLWGKDDIMMRKPLATDQAPSKDQVLWTSTHLSYDFETNYRYVGSAPTNFGGGVERDIDTHYAAVHNIFTTRALMAFLFHGGVEWERYGFNAPGAVPVPDALHSVVFPLAVDFRWSKKDMMRVQSAPGFYSDLEPFDSTDFNMPWAVAYTRLFSERFQLGLGISFNPARESPILGGGGFRWQINDRWKLKFLLPRPQIEYRAAPALHIWAGSDFDGNTYRVGNRFGSARNDPRLNNAWVDYQEIRVAGGLSWNILPLLELNGEAGYMLERRFNFHNNDLRSTSGKAPYVGISLRYLFLIREDKRPINEQMRALERELPWLRENIRTTAVENPL